MHPNTDELASDVTELSLITVTYRSASTMGAFLAAARQAAPTAQLVVVDNASDDDTTAVVEQHAPAATVLTCARTWALGADATLAPHRQAANGCSSSIRTWCCARWRCHHIPLHTTPASGQVYLSATMSVFPGRDFVPTPPGGGLHDAGVLSSPAAGARFAGTNPPQAIWWAYWGALPHSQRDIPQVRGFDPRYFMLYEDRDLGAKYRRSGLPLRPLGTLVGTHAHGGSSRGVSSAQREAWAFISWIEYVAIGGAADGDPCTERPFSMFRRPSKWPGRLSNTTSTAQGTSGRRGTSPHRNLRRPSAPTPTPIIHTHAVSFERLSRLAHASEDSFVLWGGFIGGAERQTASLAAEVRAQGTAANVLFVCKDRPLSIQLERDSVPFHTLGYSRGACVARHPRALTHAVEGAGADVTVVGSFGYLGGVLRVGGFRGPILGVEHGVLHQIPSMAPHRRAVRSVDRAVGAATHDAEIAVSRYMEDLARTKLHGRRLVLIPHGVTSAEARAANRNSEDGALTVGYAGRLHDGKGVEVLLRAIAIVHNGSRSRLRIAGDGPTRASLEAQASRLGIAERVEFLGWSDDINSFWDECDIAVAPAAELAESFSMNTLEAMAGDVQR